MTAVTVRKAGCVVLAIVAGLLLAELFLRLVVPVEIRYETWFTPGIHRYDSELGFTYTPRYRGLMRHPDKLYRGVPLTLDANGFRLANTSPTADAAPRSVVILGGRSVMMGYGLRDADTVPGVLARESTIPLQVRNTAWAGWSLWTNWLIYRRMLDGQADFDLAVVAIYNEDWTGYDGIDDYEWNWPQPPEDVVFAQLPGVRLWPDGLIARAGRWPYRSYLLYGLLRALAPAPPPPAPAAPSGASADGFVRYLAYIRDELARNGTRTLIVCLPRKDFPADHYAPFTRALPPDLPWVDLHAELADKADALGWIAGNHYGGPLSQAVAHALAPHVRALLDGPASDTHDPEQWD